MELMDVYDTIYRQNTDSQEFDTVKEVTQMESICPNCEADSEWLEMDSAKLDGVKASQRVHCFRCGCIWLESYEFIGNDILTPGKEIE